MANKTRDATILTPAMLADELGISLEDANTLMQREGFPSTPVGESAHVVHRNALLEWVLRNSKGYDASFSLPNFENQTNAQK